MTARLEQCFARLAEEKRAGLIPFITAGDPSVEETAAILAALPAAGADIIEIGMPFSDPMADGPAVQRANRRALQGSINLPKIFALVRDFRKTNDKTPLVLMGYANPVHHYGYEAFARDAAAAGVDGVIIVDLPPEEDAGLRRALAAASLSLIRLVTPTTDQARFARIADGASGFLYYVSVAGVTGAGHADFAAVEKAYAEKRAASKVPIAVGFGIKTPQDAARVGGFADAVVVGSAILEKMEAGMDAGGKVLKPLSPMVSEFVRDLRAALPVKGPRRAAGGVS